MDDGAVPVADLVRRAQAGDRGAWTALVEEFRGVATGLAAGREDVVQDAFVTAYQHLGDLSDPQAFPAWFVAVVRSKGSRHSRAEARASGPRAVAPDGGPDPLEIVVSGDEAQRLRAAVESLPEHERVVIALHYLAGLPYARVAEVLGISVPAAKKRAFSARRRLKEALPTGAAALASARSVPAGPLPGSVAVFLAVRHRNHTLLRDLLAADPGLVAATEEWTQEEAMQFGLQNAEDATPLIRAVQTGDLDLVTLILEAGADPAQRCGCAGAETALWTAALYGEAAIVAVLLAAGTDPNSAAFEGATPLAVAAQRGNREIAGLLLAAGADPSISDAGGRTAADWADRADGSALRTPSSPRRTGDAAGADLLATGVRALDLFAPIGRGSVQWWPAAWELGQFALLTEIVRAIGPGEFWQIGFATGAYDAESGRQWVKQFPLETRLRLTPSRRSAAERRAHFEAMVRDLGRSPHDKIVMILVAPGHHHDVTLAAAQLADDPHVLTTIVIEPATRAATGARPVRPEGFDAQVSFDPWRALRRLWPAVDALTTTAATYPSGRHCDLADAARAAILQYRAVDPELEMLDPEAYAQAELAARAQRLHRALAQPFHLWEHVTALPGESTPYDEMLDTIAAILAT